MNGSGSVIPASAYNNAYGYTGRRLDIETGLWYFRARYFSNELGRFISRDPLGYVDGMSLYGAYFAQWQGLDPSGKLYFWQVCRCLKAFTIDGVAKGAVNMAKDTWDGMVSALGSPKQAIKAMYNQMTEMISRLLSGQIDVQTLRDIGMTELAYMMTGIDSNGKNHGNTWANSGYIWRCKRLGRLLVEIAPYLAGGGALAAVSAKIAQKVKALKILKKKKKKNSNNSHDYDNYGSEFDGPEPYGRQYEAPDPWSREPKSVQDKMALEAAKEGQGQKLIDNLGDPMYKGMEKWELKIKSNDGKDSVIHYVKDPKTGELMDFKFKKHSTEGSGDWASKPEPKVSPGGN